MMGQTNTEDVLFRYYILLHPRLNVCITCLTRCACVHCLFLSFCFVNRPNSHWWNWKQIIIIIYLIPCSSSNLLMCVLVFIRFHACAVQKSVRFSIFNDSYYHIVIHFLSFFFSLCKIKFKLFRLALCTQVLDRWSSHMLFNSFSISVRSCTNL